MKKFETDVSLGNLKCAFRQETIEENCAVLEIKPSEAENADSLGLTNSVFFEFGFAVMTCKTFDGEMFQFLVLPDTDLTTLTFSVLAEPLAELKKLIS